jgi:transposase
MKKNAKAAGEVFPAPEGEFAAYIGIDWADREHVWRLQEAGSRHQERGTIEQSPEKLDGWVSELRQRFGGRPVVVCLEQGSEAIIMTLAKYDHVVLFLAHPTTAALYRASFSPSGAKDDGRDAGSLLDLLLRHPDQLTRWNPDTAETRQLQILSEHRRELVDQRTACSNRMKALLKVYFPQLLRWFDDVTSASALAMLQRWSTLDALQRSKPATIRAYLLKHRCEGAKIDLILADLAGAVSATTDIAILSTSARAMGVAIRQVVLLNLAIQQYEEELATLSSAHPLNSIVRSFPGVGEALGPRLIAALGTQRDRFATAHDLQCFSGIAPVTKQSSGSKFVSMRKACPIFIRQTFHEWANCSRRTCPWAREFYQAKRDAGKKHHAAIRALAFKWIRILFRCWKDNTPYEEAQYNPTSAPKASPCENPLDIQMKILAKARSFPA